MDAKLPKKQLYMILIGVSLVILSMSLEVMMKVKDVALYDQWFAEVVKTSTDLSSENAFSVYVTGNLSVYFSRVIVPMAFGIHTYFAYTKIRINKLFVFMWTVLLLGGIAYIAVTKEFDSIFYYLNMILQGTLVLTVLSLSDVIDQQKTE
jgi:hypothetical protein